MGGEGSGRYPKGSTGNKVEISANEWESFESKLAGTEEVTEHDVVGKGSAVRRQIVNRTVTELIETEDSELADAVRNLTWKALNQANMILDSGPHAARLAIIKLFVGNAARLIGATSSTTVEEGRVAFQELLANMRELPSTNGITTPALTPTTDDSD